MIVAGVGFSSEADAQEILAALDAACSVQGIDPADIEIVATIGSRAQEAAYRMACKERGYEERLITRDEALAFDDKVLTRSEASLKAIGLACVSEMTALAAAGDGAELLGPRVTEGKASCALAGLLPKG